jgi:hypothetical protein
MTATAAPPPPFRTRSDVLFASQAAVAVILRRGPKMHWQLLRWNTRTDAVEPGQWMKGRIALCDLSPDGSKLLYFAAQEHLTAPWRQGAHAQGALDRPGFAPELPDQAALKKFKARHPNRRVPRYLLGATASKPGKPPPRENSGTWTAISTPPYFSALSYWPAYGRWSGGGCFASNRRVLLCESEDAMTPVLKVPMPNSFTVDRWDRTLHQELPATIAAAPHRQAQDLHAQVSPVLLAAGARFVDWALRDGADLLFGCDGSIYRQRQWTGTATPDLLIKATRIVDLTGNRFTLVAPPSEALRW